jgi:hypothetical protein
MSDLLSLCIATCTIWHILAIVAVSGCQAKEIFPVRGPKMRPILLPKTLQVLMLLFAMPAHAAEPEIEIKISQALPALSRLNIMQGCIDSGGEQATALVAQILRRQNIRAASDAPLSLTVTTSPCNEFAFADQGPRDLEDAPRGALGSKIITPINKSRKAPDTASLRLTIRNAQNTVFWDGRAKSGITPRQSAQSAALDLVLPLLNAALSQRTTTEK